MKHAFARAALFCLALTQSLQAGAEEMTQSEKDVKAAVERMTSAFENGQIDVVMSAYEPGAAVAFEPGQPVSDAAQLRAMFTAMAAAHPQFEYAGHDVIVSGDIAVHIAPWRMSGRTPDGQAIAQSGLSVAVLRRQGDGSWKMVIDNPHGARLMEHSR